MLALAASINSKKNETSAKKEAPVRPGVFSVVCSLTCFRIDLMCWQLVSVKTTKHLLDLPF